MRENKQGRDGEINTYTFIVVLAQFDHLLRVSTRLVKLFEFGIGRGTIVQNTNSVAIFLIQRLRFTVSESTGDKQWGNYFAEGLDGGLEIALLV